MEELKDIKFKNNLANYYSDHTSASDNFQDAPPFLTDNLSFAIKNNVLITYSLGEVKQSDILEKKSEQ